MLLTPKDRRTLAAGVAVVTLLVVLGRGVPSVLDWRAQRGPTGNDSVRELHRLELLVRTHAHTRRALVVARARLADADAALLGGATQAAAGAQLAGVLSDAAAVSEVQLATVQLRSDTVAVGGQALARVAAHASLRGDLTSLALFFHTLEEGPTLLVVREFAISEADPGLPSTRLERLRLDVLVEGIYEPATQASVPPGIRAP